MDAEAGCCHSRASHIPATKGISSRTTGNRCRLFTLIIYVKIRNYGENGRLVAVFCHSFLRAGISQRSCLAPVVAHLAVAAHVMRGSAVEKSIRIGRIEFDQLREIINGLRKLLGHHIAVAPVEVSLLVGRV